MKKPLDCAGKRITFERPRVMGIINVTPDSFSDGGRFATAGAALDHAVALAEAGAELLDVGGESTRPGADEVPLQQELDRVIPVIELLRTRLEVVLSIDTSKAEVMRAAVAAGAGMINDVYALRRGDALHTAAALKVPVCLMHMQGEPRSMQDQPSYQDVLAEIETFLLERANKCIQAGIPPHQIVLDPGFGFGKSLHHNLDVLRGLGRLSAHGHPLLAGLSRKSMLAAITGRGVEHRLAGSLALAMLAAQGGADILRVHDVAESRDVLDVLHAVWPNGPDAE